MFKKPLKALNTNGDASAPTSSPPSSLHSTAKQQNGEINANSTNNGISSNENAKPLAIKKSNSKQAISNTVNSDVSKPIKIQQQASPKHNNETQKKPTTAKPQPPNKKLTNSTSIGSNMNSAANGSTVVAHLSAAISNGSITTTTQVNNKPQQKATTSTLTKTNSNTHLDQINKNTIVKRNKKPSDKTTPMADDTSTINKANDLEVNPNDNKVEEVTLAKSSKSSSTNSSSSNLTELSKQIVAPVVESCLTQLKTDEIEQQQPTEARLDEEITKTSTNQPTNRVNSLTTEEEEYKKKLEEKRRVFLEKAAKEAEIERLKQEVIRLEEEKLRKEEEERERLFEEEQLRLHQIAREQEDERLRLAIEQNERFESEKRAKEENEKRMVSHNFILLFVKDD